MNRAKIESSTQRNKSSPAWAVALVVLSLLLSPQSVPAASTNQASGPEIFSVGMAKVCFRNVNRNDAIAAYKVFLERAGRRFGNTYTASAEIYDDTLSFEAAIQNEPMNLAVMDPWQYLTMNTALKELDQDPAGQQICALFRIDRMVPFEDTQLDTTRKLRAIYAALQTAGAPTNRSAPPPAHLGIHDLSPLGSSTRTRNNEP